MSMHRPFASLLFLFLSLSLATLVACGDEDCVDCGEDSAPTISPCVVDDLSYEVGESVPSGDCNTCACSDPGDGTTEGVVTCTTMACACSPEDCGPALGMPNYLCDDGVTMAGPGDCELQEGGACGWTVVQCPPEGYDACEGQACGEACDPCAPNDDGCPDPSGLWACDPTGTCVEGEVACDQDPCAEVTCEGSDPVCDGDTLMGGFTNSCDAETGQCEPSPAAPPQACGFGCADGACLPEPGQGYDPCAGLSCGSMCSLCDPNDPDCMETGEIKACNHAGGCEGSFDPELCAYEACEPGAQFSASDGCNTCTCPQEGYAMENDCTEMECVDACEPGAEFMAEDGCNTCVCPESGNKEDAACTKKLCACETSEECGEGAFCDFSGDDCGVWGQPGKCVAKPEMCIAGGVGACGCDGSWATNGCELQAGGADLMKFGGCQGADPVALFACGDTECQIEDEFCMISMNDVAGPDQPEYYSSCGDLPDGCASGDCSCMGADPWQSCFDGTGTTMMFYPGG